MARRLGNHPCGEEKDENGNYTDLAQKRLEMVIDIRSKVEAKALYEAEYANLRAHIDSTEETNSWIVERIRSLNQETLRLQKQKPAEEFYWLTVSPKPETTFDELEKKLNKFVKSKMILGTVYSYELREDGTPHFHMIVKPDGVSDSDFRKRAYNPFKDIAPKGVKICRMPSSWYEDKIRYLKGEKDDPAKHDMIVRDRNWRSDMSIEPIYYTGCLTDTLPESDDESP